MSNKFSVFVMGNSNQELRDKAVNAAIDCFGEGIYNVVEGYKVWENSLWGLTIAGEKERDRFCANIDVTFEPHDNNWPACYVA